MISVLMVSVKQCRGECQAFFSVIGLGTSFLIIDFWYNNGERYTVHDSRFSKLETVYRVPTTVYRLI